MTEGETSGTGVEDDRRRESPRPPCSGAGTGLMARFPGRMRCGPYNKRREEKRNHLEAPADLEVEALVDRLLAGRFLPEAFKGEGQARDGGPAGAEAVGVGGAI